MSTEKEIDYSKFPIVNEKLDIQLKEYFSNILPGYFIEARIIDYGDSTKFGHFNIEPMTYILKNIDFEKSESELAEALYKEVVRSVEGKIQEMIDNGTGVRGELKDFRRSLKVIYDGVLIKKEGLIYKIGFGNIPNVY